MNKTKKHKHKSKNVEIVKFKAIKNNKYKIRTLKNKKNNTVLDLAYSKNVNLVPFEKNFGEDLTISNERIINQFVKELLSPFSPESIKPASNFYNYINYMWLKNTEISETQKYLSQIDNFRLVQDNVYHQLEDILLDYIKNNNNRLSKNLSNFRQTAINLMSVGASRKYAKDYTSYLDKLRKDKKNIWQLLSHINHHENVSPFAPFYWTIKPDEKNSGIFACYLEPHSFASNDYSIYIDDDSNVIYKEMYKMVLNKYYKKVFDFLMGPNNNIDVDSIFNVEVKMFNALFCDNKKIDASELNGYNRIHKDEALSKYGFDWVKFCKEFGFKKAPDFFICKNLNYLKCCTELLLNEWDSEEWRAYWLLIQYRKFIKITKKGREIFYNFHGQFQKSEVGQFFKKNKASHLSSINPLCYSFNAFFTREYVKKYYDAKKVEYVRILSEELRLVFIRIVKRNKWLSEKTRDYAIKKIESIKFIFVQPLEIIEDPDLDYCSDDLNKNINLVDEWRSRLFMSLVGKPVVDFPLIDWTRQPAKLVGNQAYVVNASYTPLTNSIYVPLGYIQEPFVDMNERGIEYNLANVGFTLAHELSHCLDESGSKYNIDGNLENWWTESDTKKYKNIQADILKQYEEFAKRDGIEFDASLSIGEDIADISGLAICEEYLRDYQIKNKMLTPNRALSFNQFYTYYCIQMRQIIPNRALMKQLNTNPHPPDVFRCNVPLTRSQTFRALINVKKGDGMWWHNTNTVW